MEGKYPPPKADVPTDTVKTSEYYKVKNIPERFNNPYWFTGYGCQIYPPEHPRYRTTSQEYGWYPPSIHTVPTSYYPMNQTFSKSQATGGMYRNFSLNTSLDKSTFS